MPKPKFNGEVNTSGDLKLDDAPSFKRHYQQHFKGKRIYVTIDEEHKTRSDAQNNYIWGICYKLIADETGHAEDEVHEMMKLRFLPKRMEVTNKKTGEVQEQTIPGSSARLTTKEFAEYVDKIQRWASSFLGLYIPSPGEVITGDEQ